MALQDELELRARQIVMRLTHKPPAPLCDKLGGERSVPYFSSMPISRQARSLLGARTLLGAPGIATRNKKLLGAKGIATRSKDATILFLSECPWLVFVLDPSRLPTSRTTT